MIVPKEDMVFYEENPNYQPPTNLSENGDALPVAYASAPVTTFADEEPIKPLPVVTTQPISIQGTTPVTNSVANTAVINNPTVINNPAVNSNKEVLDYSGYESSQNPVTVLLAIDFTVKEENGFILQGANIAVNGVPTAQTNENGKVFLPSVNANDEIRVTYIGYGDVVFKAGETIKEVVLRSTSIMLDNVPLVIPPKTTTPTPPTKKYNWFGLAVITTLAVVAAKKLSKSEPKTAKVKI